MPEKAGEAPRFVGRSRRGVAATDLTASVSAATCCFSASISRSRCESCCASSFSRGVWGSIGAEEFGLPRFSSLDDVVSEGG